MFLKIIAKSTDLTSFLTSGTDFTVSSLVDMVNTVTQACPPRSLQELVLYAHGSNGAFSIGSDQLGGIATPRDEAAKLKQLEPLSPCFGGSNGRPRLILCVCEAGRNPDSLLEIAKAIGQPVFACTGYVRPTLGIGYGWWCGDILMADPISGTKTTVARIPDPPLELA